WMMRIARLARIHPGKFGRDGLAEDDSACRTRQRDARCVPRRAVARIHRRAVSGRHVDRIDQVLDSYRQPVQQATRRSRVDGARLLERSVAVEVFPCAYCVLTRGDAFE